MILSGCGCAARYVLRISYVVRRIRRRQVNFPIRLRSGLKAALRRAPDKDVLGQAGGREIFWVKIGTGFWQRISALSLATVLDIVNRGLDRSRHRRKKSVRRELIKKNFSFLRNSFCSKPVYLP